MNYQSSLDFCGTSPTFLEVSQLTLIDHTNCCRNSHRNFSIIQIKLGAYLVTYISSHLHELFLNVLSLTVKQK
jgi:hypothetical protein